MTNLDRIIADAVRRIIRTEGEPAKLGRADGTIRFTDASGTTHRLRKWVRVQRGAEMKELVAYDTVGVPEHTDLPVRVAHRDGSSMIIGKDGLAADEFSGGRTLVPPHSHDRFSYNPHYATGPSFLPLMAIPSSPPAMTVEVQQGWYRYRGDWKHWDTADSSSLASYTPAPGFHHFIVLCLDRENNALAIVDGNDKPAPTAGVNIDANDIDDVTIPDAYRPLCAIRLFNGQTEVLPPDIFMDARLWGGETFTDPPAHSLGHAVSTMLALPQLRGFWPLSSVDESDAVYDVSGQGRTLTANGAPAFAVDGFVPYVGLDGTADYYSIVDQAALDITGSLTVGCWVYFDASGTYGIISKYEGTGDHRTFRLLTVSDVIRFDVSALGTNVLTTVTGATATAGTWHFTAARYTPSSELAVWLDTNKATNTTSIPASIHSGNADLQIGAQDTSSLLDGRVALPFLCAAALSDDIIDNLYQQTRHLFGV